MNESLSLQQAIQKMESFCAYQERCHEDVKQKMRAMTVDYKIFDEVIAHLINHNFLNEERFACSYARGKHRIKNWGKVRITNELKLRNISQRLIATALNEIDDNDYFSAFDQLAERHWNSLNEKNNLKKRKRFCDFLLRKGFESQLIYQKLQEFEKH